MKPLLVIFILSSSAVFGQQEPLSGMYWNNYSYFNPAMSGVVYKYEANASWRNQWDKVNGAPNTLFLNYGMNLADKHGLGSNYVYETIGFSRINRAKVNYNYQLKFKEDRKLVFGTALSFNHIQWVHEWITPTSTIDPSIPSQSQQLNLNLDLGLAYYSKNLTAGLSATQFPVYRSSGNFKTAPHFFGNFRFEGPILPSSEIVLETKFRTDLIKYSQDFNLGFNFRKILEISVGYRTSDAILFNLTGIIAKNYRIGYQYEFTVNKLSSISRGTHEIAIGLHIPN